jgi:Reverse transcriptase (RNA-dependent DNA polymerase)
MDWLKALDFKLALRNCHQDLLFDWYRDPWGWPELDWVVKKEKTEFLLQRLNASDVHRAAKIEVAKENFSTRPALIIDPLDRLIYQALADQLSVKLIGNLQPWVYGPRLTRKKPARGVWADGKVEWSSFRERLKLHAGSRAALETDVVSFFASVPISRVTDEVANNAGETRVTKRLIALLTGWEKIPARSGLPQRYVASSALANMYLAPVDDILARYGVRRPRRGWLPPRSARWVDDMWLFGNDSGRLRRAQLEIQDALRGLGLNMNLGKTRLLEDEDVPLAIQQREHSAVDDGLTSDEPTTDALDDLIDRLLERPEMASRSSVRFATHRMRKYGVLDRVDDFAEVAQRMPHCADGLARLFRDSGKWSELGDWYDEYIGSNWGRIEWSIAQFGTMFPSQADPPEQVHEFFVGVLQTSPSVPLTALAAQRLAAWDPELARATIHEAAAKAEHPLQRRVLALAALAAGEGRTLVRSLLSEFEETAVTLAMLEDRRFRKLKLVADFEGD